MFHFKVKKTIQCIQDWYNANSDVFVGAKLWTEADKSLKLIKVAVVNSQGHSKAMNFRVKNISQNCRQVTSTKQCQSHFFGYINEILQAQIWN